MSQLVDHLVDAREILVYLLLHGHIFFVEQPIEVVILVLHFWPALLHDDLISDDNLADSAQVLYALVDG